MGRDLDFQSLLLPVTTVYLLRSRCATKPGLAATRAPDDKECFNVGAVYATALVNVSARSADGPVAEERFDVAAVNPTAEIVIGRANRASAPAIASDGDPLLTVNCVEVDRARVALVTKVRRVLIRKATDDLIAGKVGIAAGHEPSDLNAGDSIPAEFDQIDLNLEAGSHVRGIGHGAVGSLNTAEVAVIDAEV